MRNIRERNVAVFRQGRRAVTEQAGSNVPQGSTATREVRRNGVETRREDEKARTGKEGVCYLYDVVDVGNGLWLSWVESAAKCGGLRGGLSSAPSVLVITHRKEKKEESTDPENVAISIKAEEGAASADPCTPSRFCPSVLGCYQSYR